MVESLLSKCETLSSKPQYHHQKKKSKIYNQLATEATSTSQGYLKQNKEKYRKINLSIIVLGQEKIKGTKSFQSLDLKVMKNTL
jgi:hypothetical protein